MDTARTALNYLVNRSSSALDLHHPGPCKDLIKHKSFPGSSHQHLESPGTVLYVSIHPPHLVLGYLRHSRRNHVLSRGDGSNREKLDRFRNRASSPSTPRGTPR